MAKRKDDSALRFWICRRLAAGLARMVRLSLYQPLCLRCNRILVFSGEQAICLHCLDQIDPLEGRICLHCGKPSYSEADTCGECLLDPPVYRRHVSFGVYEGVLRDLLLIYKYGPERRLRWVLSEWLMQCIREHLPVLPDGVVPVPDDRRRNRDFSPVGDLAKIVAREMGVPCVRNALRKVRSTPPQAGLTRVQRKLNVRAAFSRNRRIQLAGKRLLLIDDIYTTGSTVKACTAALQECGAEIWVFSLARSA